MPPKYTQRVRSSSIHDTTQILRGPIVLVELLAPLPARTATDYIREYALYSPHSGSDAPCYKTQLRAEGNLCPFLHQSISRKKGATDMREAILPLDLHSGAKGI